MLAATMTTPRQVKNQLAHSSKRFMENLLALRKG
jgi:hypothetical protein